MIMVDAGGSGKRESRGEPIIEDINKERISSFVQNIAYLVSLYSFTIP